MHRAVRGGAPLAPCRNMRWSQTIAALVGISMVVQLTSGSADTYFDLKNSYGPVLRRLESVGDPWLGGSSPPTSSSVAWARNAAPAPVSHCTLSADSSSKLLFRVAGRSASQSESAALFVYSVQQARWLEFSPEHVAVQISKAVTMTDTGDALRNAQVASEWPQARFGHASALLFSGSATVLMMHGGTGIEDTPLNDTWILQTDHIPGIIDMKSATALSGSLSDHFDMPEIVRPSPWLVGTCCRLPSFA